MIKNTSKIKPTELKKQVNELYQKGPDAVYNYVSDLHRIIEHLSDTIQKLEKRIAKLEEALNKDSHNSNKLPLCSLSGQCSIF
jgi:polyhydroxyalkanoate synthesis regulator phasin